MHVTLSNWFLHFQVNDLTRKLHEEEEVVMATSNAIKKLEAETNRCKEEVENMDFR